MAKTRYQKLSSMISRLSEGPVEDSEEPFQAYREMVAWNCAKMFEASFREEETQKLENKKPSGLARLFENKAQKADTATLMAQDRVVERYDFNLQRLEKGIISVNDLLKETELLTSTAKAPAAPQGYKTLRDWKNDQQARGFKAST